MFESFKLGNGTLSGLDEMRVRGCAYGEFAEKGFSGASLKNIAGMAEVTEKQLLNAFGSKEELLTELIEEIIDRASQIETNSSLQMLACIVDSIIHEIEIGSRKAGFIEMLFTDRTIPKDVVDKCEDCLAHTRIYDRFERDRLKGLIKCDDTGASLIMFFKSVYNIVKGYVTAGIKPPSTDWLMGLLYKKTDEPKTASEALIKKQNSVITTFASDFDSILFADLDTGKMEVYQANGPSDRWIAEMAAKGYDEYRKGFADIFLYPEDVEWFLTETESSNILKRFDEDPVLYIDHRVISRGRPFFYQTIIALDPYSAHDNKILIGGHKIAADMRPRPTDSEIGNVYFG